MKSAIESVKGGSVVEYTVTLSFVAAIALVAISAYSGSLGI